MMENIIGIRLSGVDNVVYLQEFLKAGNDLMELLVEVDTSTSSNYQPTTDWKLRKLSYSSPVELLVEGVVKEDQADNRANIIETVRTGIKLLKTTNERPRGFTDKALEKARELSKMMSDGVEKLEVFSNDTFELLSLGIIDNVTVILRPGREIFGSIEGHLETLNSHDGFKFAIYEPILLRRIRCELLNKNDSLLKKRVYELYEHNVLVTGLLTTNIRGEAQFAKVTDIMGKNQKQRLKDASEIVGIYDVKGDIDPVEYVRSLRE